ncbi:hypothetical protein [Frankia sp. KB5]|nr:hypothetical protein [Frankia sp. KB5]
MPDGDPEWDLAQDISGALHTGDRLAVVVGLVAVVLIVAFIVVVTLL